LPTNNSNNTLDICSNDYIIVYITKDARVAEWQTRKHEGLVPKGLGVQLPPRAFNLNREAGKAHNNKNFFLDKIKK
jgi:hypothetical protein